MKRLTVSLAALMLLTGCQSIDTITEDEMRAKAPILTAYSDEVMMPKKEQNHVLFKRLTDLEESAKMEGNPEADDLWLTDRWTDLADMMKVNSFSNNVARVELTDSDISKEALEIISEELGEEFKTFLKEAKSTKEIEYIVEQVIGKYGVVYHRMNDYAALFVTASGKSYLDEAKKSQIEKFCGDELTVTATTAGEENSLVELSFPSYVVRSYLTELNNTTAYYQIFSNQSHGLEKIRLVINQYEKGYLQGKLEADKLLPLQRMLAEIGVSQEEESKLLDDIYNVVNGDINKKKGSLNKLDYTISKSNAEVYYEDIIEVTLTLNN